VIHAARVGAFAKDLEALRGPSAPSDDVFVYLPKQNFVLSYTLRLLVHTSSPCLRCYPRRHDPTLRVV